MWNKNSNILCLTIDNLFILLKPNCIVNIFPDIEILDLSKLIPPDLNFSGESLRGDEFSLMFAKKIFELSQRNDLTIPKYDLSKEVLSQKESISHIEKEIIKQPFHELGDLKKLFSSNTPLAILFSGLTTIFSFSTLFFSSHNGTSSMGLLLFISLSNTLITSLILLPIFIKILRIK